MRLSHKVAVILLSHHVLILQPLQCCKIDDKMDCSSALPSSSFLSAYVFQESLINRPSNRQYSCMDNMSVLRQALDIRPFHVSVDEIAVKQAVIDHLAKEVCLAVRLKVPHSKFDVSDEVMKTCLATAQLSGSLSTTCFA